MDNQTEREIIIKELQSMVINEFNQELNIHCPNYEKLADWHLAEVKRTVEQSHRLPKIDGVTEINGQGWRECSDDHDKIYYQGRICPLCENKIIAIESIKDILKEVSLLYRKVEDITKDFV